MKTQTKVQLGIGIALAVGVVITVIALALQPSDTPEAEKDSTGTFIVTDTDTHQIGEPATDPAAAVQVVEFLDFECETCGAISPTMEQLRHTYAGKVEFFVRYFPVPSHQNAMTAALAVEAAAQQGAFEQMHDKMFATQAEWGEASESKADVFRGFAEELGLDVAAYDAAIADEATLKRVEKDARAGRALGVTGTPTLFIDGQMLNLQHIDDIQAGIEAALEARAAQ